MSLAKTSTGLDDLPRETAPGGLIETHVTPTLNDEYCQTVMSKTIDLFGACDALVVEATKHLSGPIELMSEERLREAVEVNIIEPLSMLRAVSTQFRKQGRGTIICLTGHAPRTPLPLLGATAVTEAGLERLCQTLRVELKPFNVKVVTVHQGSVQDLFGGKTSSRRGAGRTATARAYRPLLSRFKSAMAQRREPVVSPSDVAAIVERILVAKRPRAHYRVKASRR